ncbi:probable translocon-associated protein subunit alpha [Coccomyxa sp. Obi]|nr:probable translocon-associated protein subunit alpha [Coccomyxa sp. Obi]
MKASLLLLVAAALCVAAVNGQSHPLSDLPAPLEGVQTVFWLPEYPEKQFPAGALVEAVVGLHNNANERLNITAIMGSLNNAQAFHQYFQNFTYQPQQAFVGPGEEAAVSYYFMPDESFPAREFQVALTVFYNTPSGTYSSTFFNQTIDIVEVPSFIDIQGLFLLLPLLGLIAGAAYLVKSALEKYGILKPKKGTRKVEVKKRVAAAGEENEWLKGTNFNQGGAKKVAKAKAPVKVEGTAAAPEGAPAVVKKTK